MFMKLHILNAMWIYRQINTKQIIRASYVIELLHRTQSYLNTGSIIQK